MVELLIHRLERKPYGDLPIDIFIDNRLMGQVLNGESKTLSLPLKRLRFYKLQVAFSGDKRKSKPNEVIWTQSKTMEFITSYEKYTEKEAPFGEDHHYNKDIINYTIDKLFQLLFISIRRRLFGTEPDIMLMQVKESKRKDTVSNEFSIRQSGL